MPKQYFFSINLLIKSDSHLENAISSVISDENFFLQNVQLILIDSVCSDFSIQICSKYNSKYPDNVYFVDAGGKNPAASYNDAASLCTGTYISYIDNYGEYSKKALSLLYAKLQSGKVPVVSLLPLIASPGLIPQPYVDNFQSGLIKLKETPFNFIMTLGSYFFNHKAVQNILFDSSLIFHSDVKFISQVLLQTYSFVFFDGFSYTSSYPTERDFFRFEPQYSKNFYINSIKNFVIPMLQTYPDSVLIQSIMLYIINIKFSLNLNERYKYVIIGSYVDKFFESVSQALSYINDYVILEKKLYSLVGLDTELSFRFLRLKYQNPLLKPDIDLIPTKDLIEKTYFDVNGSLVSQSFSGEFVASVNQSLAGTSKEIFAEISAVNFDNDGLYIDAVLHNCSYLESNQFSVFSVVNEQKSKVIPSKVYTLQKFFDVPFLKKFSFRFFVPVSGGKNIDSIHLLMKYKNFFFRLNMKFETVFSRLSSQIKSSYWNFLDRVMTYDTKSKSLIIRRATESLLAVCENKFLSEIAKQLSFTEFLYYRQLRKNVQNIKKEKADFKYFLFYDEAGINCNGNLLFRYFSKVKKDLKFQPFYVVKRDSDEYMFLIDSGYDNILETASKKAKITALGADVIFASDCDVYDSVGFNQKDSLFLRDLFNAKIISVKDFFMTYATAQFDNRLRDNTYMFFCSSDSEKQRLLKNVYDYDEEMIHITGYPVLDSVFDKKEKVILIAPGDRRQFCIYEYSDYYRFSESKFFRTYHSLTTDKSLLESLKKNGFKLAVLMPPSIEKYIKLFHSDDTVQFYPYTEQNEVTLISKASVIVTDYSELQYRMAYLNKPVIYYFPVNLAVPQEYKNQSATQNGFGQVFFEHNQLVRYLIQNIKTNFPQPQLYAQRCHSFFKYIDNQNCKRIFDTVIRYEL